VAAQQLAQAEANRKVAAAEAERARQLVAKGFYAQSKADDAACATRPTPSSAAIRPAPSWPPSSPAAVSAKPPARLEQARAQLVNARARAAQLTLSAPPPAPC
jgi:HlyD family secretion protein